MLTADLIIPALCVTGKKQAFQTIAEEAAGLCPAGANDIFTALIERERIGSTAIGCGVAIPHIKVEGIKRIYGIMARLQEPVEYEAPDGRPVDLIFLLLAPADSKTTLHLKMLAQISRFLKDEKSCTRIRAARGRDSMEAVLLEWLSRQAA